MDNLSSTPFKPRVTKRLQSPCRKARASARSARGGSPARFEPLEGRTLLSAYYVSTAGSDGAAGTSSAPWRTLQHAANSVSAGDSVVVRPGSYAGFHLTASGTAASRIAFSAEPGAVVDRRNASTADGINLEGASHVTVEGFAVRPASGQTLRSGIRTVTGSGVVVRNNTVDNVAWWGVLTGFSEGVVVEGN